ncbi:hypothetical protein GCK72_004178 [Caenorhabditis remanei]|uniref:RING-type domain-containing protein n=1 Tax=Caenorhabditis remanei TaxID=31234 RepID=A0A6A5HBG7_CAERE|nr:hypothetical protein GCK72_004178 [Caenorhabditis remanei]KAF1764231.1 hypothetical protein GCK72_004178 [Caenorhabditis remanei]
MTCNICFQKYNSSIPTLIPRVLTKCGHTMCQYCIVQQMRNGKIVCPFDRKVTVVGSKCSSLSGCPHILFLDLVESLPKNFAVLEIMDNVSTGENSLEGGVDDENGASRYCDQDSHEDVTDEEAPSVPEAVIEVFNQNSYRDGDSDYDFVEEDELRDEVVSDVSDQEAYQDPTVLLYWTRDDLVSDVPNENLAAETPTRLNLYPALTEHDSDADAELLQTAIALSILDK